ncbi:hypothetical protein GOODEAATRI_033184, partial [Goodea atripinnis]
MLRSYIGPSEAVSEAAGDSYELIGNLRQPQQEINFLQEKLSSLLPKLVQESEGSTDERLKALAPFRCVRDEDLVARRDDGTSIRLKVECRSVFYLLTCTIS